ncbi:hypothetical protein E2C01_072887 [Portunus trituberculatus]|uniref:Uncharacterized protein n=1 Tax=Portunus trituberculatus TaxID=210409 RepID=A0A5B7I3R3_PORTR|nr:hypothetical protein [Portunus trituberculatus]
MQRGLSPAKGVASLVSGEKRLERKTLHALARHRTHNTTHCTHCHKSHCSSVKPREGRKEAVESLLARRRWRREDSRSCSLRHVVFGSCRESTATKVKDLHRNTY